MKYVPPYGVSDPDAHYVNGDPSIGRKGSIPPAAAFENPMRELANIITLCGITPSDEDLQQLAKAVQSSRLHYAEDTGAVNALVVAMSPPLPAATPYRTGLVVRVKVLHTTINDVTHTTLTMDAGGGAANIRLPDGSLPPDGAMHAGGVYPMTFDGTNWQLPAWSGAGGGPGTTTYVKIPYAADTSGVANQVNVAFSPAITAPTVGDVVLVKFNNTNSGATQIAVNAIANKPLVRNDGVSGPLLYGDAAKGAYGLLEWDGTSWVLLISAFGNLSPRTAPFFPEILTNNGVMTFVLGTGSIQIQQAQTWQHRGMRLFSTTSFTNPQLTFATAPNTLYHLRWDAPGTGQAVPQDSYPNGRFTLNNVVAGGAYNPSSIKEFNPSFDTTFDSMLIARVGTDGANNLVVNALLNKTALYAIAAKTTQSANVSPGTSWMIAASATLNWSRTPSFTVSFTHANFVSDWGRGLTGIDFWNGRGLDYTEPSGVWINRYSFQRIGGVLGNTDTYYLDCPWDVELRA